MTRSRKIILFYTIGFIILYLEPISLGGLTFGILWKLLLMFLVFLPILYRSIVQQYIEGFALFSLLLAFKMLLSYSSMEYLMHTFTSFAKALMFPILYLYFISKMEKKSLVFLAKHFAILIVISFIPYMLGLLSPLGEGYNLSAYGHEGEFGLVGVFINPHSASISIAFAMILISTYIKKDNSIKINLFYISLLALGFYELIATYVRTGMAVYIVALIYIYLKNMTLKKMLLLVMTIVVSGIALAYLIQTNEVIRMRFEDKNKYVKHDEIGSGRLTYWKNAIDNWSGDEPIVIFIGLGEMYAEEKMYEDVGLRIFAHNDFFQMLQQEGLIGFGFFISYLLLILIFIKRHSTSEYYIVTMAIYIGMITMMMFQGGFYFNIIFFLSIYLAILKQEEYLINSTILDKNNIL